jgi:hypothetical protein
MPSTSTSWSTTRCAWRRCFSDAIDGRTRQDLADVVRVTAGCLDRSRDEDGALTELYEGVLTVQGVRYGWRAAFYTDLDGERFVADLVQFRPLDWRARVRLV